MDGNTNKVMCKGDKKALCYIIKVLNKELNNNALKMEFAKVGST